MKFKKKQSRKFKQIKREWEAMRFAGIFSVKLGKGFNE